VFIATLAFFFNPHPERRISEFFLFSPPLPSPLGDQLDLWSSSFSVEVSILKRRRPSAPLKLQDNGFRGALLSIKESG